MRESGACAVVTMDSVGIGCAGNEGGGGKGGDGEQRLHVSLLFQASSGTISVCTRIWPQSPGDLKYPLAIGSIACRYLHSI
jgi:hypothetical protein